MSKISKPNLPALLAFHMHGDTALKEVSKVLPSFENTDSELTGQEEGKKKKSGH